MEYGFKRKWVLGIICGIGLIIHTGCAKKIQTTQMAETPPEKSRQETVITPVPPVQEQPKLPEQKPAQFLSTVGLEDIFFDFDKALVRSDSRHRLEEDVRWLKENINARITIEGHCDERGTGEYNLVLGDKRASAIKAYLESSGIDSSRLKTISYGRERPFCKAHNEKCWQENRRGHFVNLTEGG